MDWTAILVAGITSAFALLGTFLGTRNAVATAQKIMEVRLEELTREVREHNGFARKMPVVEEQIRVINHRIDDLERSN